MNVGLMGFGRTVRLRHESISREAFGNGALFAARNLRGKPSGLYAMEDLLLLYYSHEAFSKCRRILKKLP